MQLIRCRKCGTVVVSDDTFLQNILDAMEAANRRARNCHPSKRIVHLQEAAQYRSMYKAFMHNLTTKQTAENETMYILSALRHHLLDTGLMTEEEISAIYDKGRKKAAAAKQQAEKEIRRVYGDFDTIGNRTMPSPTERAAMRHLK